MPLVFHFAGYVDSGCDHPDFGVIKKREGLFEKRWRDQVVGKQQLADGSTGFSDAPLPVANRAKVGFVLENPYSRILSREVLTDVPRRVRTLVVDDDNFKIRNCLCQRRFDAGSDINLTVIDRNQDADRYVLSMAMGFAKGSISVIGRPKAILG